MSSINFEEVVGKKCCSSISGGNWGSNPYPHLDFFWGTGQGQGQGLKIYLGIFLGRDRFNCGGFQV